MFENEKNNISDVLDIHLITFNRASNLDRTLSQILSEGSPIKDFQVKIWDNNSSDGTKEVVDRYKKDYPNLLYCKNKYNIGGNANIVQAFYNADKEYIWVLADNDDYCWDSWNEVVDAINKGYPGIMVSTHDCPWYDVAQFFTQTTFLPGVIYRRDLIDDNVIANMEFQISNMFPHLALSSKFINEKKDVYIVKKSVVIVGENESESYSRGGKETQVHPLMSHMNWFSGYANSLHLIRDKSTRNYIIKHNRYGSSLSSAQVFFLDRGRYNNLYDKLCVFNVLGFWGKIKFIFDLLMFYSLYRIIFIYRTERFVNNQTALKVSYCVRLFSVVKTKIFGFTKDASRKV